MGKMFRSPWQGEKKRCQWKTSDTAEDPWVGWEWRTAPPREVFRRSQQLRSRLTEGRSSRQTKAGAPWFPLALGQRLQSQSPPASLPRNPLLWAVADPARATPAFFPGEQTRAETRRSLGSPAGRAPPAGPRSRAPAPGGHATARRWSCCGKPPACRKSPRVAAAATAGGGGHLAKEPRREPQLPQLGRTMERWRLQQELAPEQSQRRTDSA